ncbi:Glycosyl phosphatidyl inositol anchor synthesis [Coniosporium tulheliwenetii]|uniref:Glycosyl phosphatidyl inositol anchor synthesis n=1 Tax=Coniosporium tulheliwenetii TaxID=3383036 RepID=A0ACC2YKI1_9PEZI|nr:Glycosyl phosphatidyl inositol anchor synthesis [Cladosporium sp. JES 115]
MDCVPDVEHNNLRDVRRSQKTRTVDFKAVRVVPIGNTKERVAREAPKPANRDWYYKSRANVFAGDGLRNEKFFESFPDPSPPTNQSTTAQELRTASMALANSTALAPYTSSSAAIKITTCSPGTIRKLVRNHKLLGSLQELPKEPPNLV